MEDEPGCDMCGEPVWAGDEHDLCDSCYEDLYDENGEPK
jgi:formylmethanofuran dehydrogenase subunit E